MSSNKLGMEEQSFLLVLGLSTVLTGFECVDKHRLISTLGSEDCGFGQKKNDTLLTKTPVRR